MRGRVVRALVTGTLLALVACVPAAEAAFPGQNGKIVYDESSVGSGTGFISTINPDGTGYTPIADSLDWPRFSPDGTKIAVADTGRRIKVMNQDGTGLVTVVQSNGIPRDPAWSPDQTRIAFENVVPGTYWELLIVTVSNGQTTIPFTRYTGTIRTPAWSPRGDRIAFERNGDIWTIQPDGTNLTQLTFHQRAASPDWSPDGSKLVFRGAVGNNWDIHVMNSDGSNETPLTDDAASDDWPAWSPDGSKIVFYSSRSPAGIYTMNVDGTNVSLLVAGGNLPDWQPIPYPGHIRPKGATPLRVSLVPAYAQCTAPNREHGPPLAFGSCHPPAQESGELAVGASMTGFVRYKTVVGNPGTPAVDEADIALRVEITDVSEQGSLADYAGEVEAQATARLTDRDAGVPGTATDVRFPLTTQCTPTAATGVGSTCSLNTTLDALIPDAIGEGRRTVLQLSQAQVIDGGADADTATEPNNVFLRQGVFVP